MRWKHALAGVATAALLFESGCTYFLKDLRYPGGYAGYELDKHAFDASYSKQLALLRATIIVALAARMANGTISNPDDADNVAHSLAAASDEINYAAADLYQVTYPDGAAPQDPCLVGSQNPVPTASPSPGATASGDLCAGYRVNFEAEMPLLEGKIFSLMLTSLPRDKLKKFIGDAKNGNVLGGAWDALTVIFVGLKGLHYGLGAYRSGEETVVANFDKKNCSGTPRQVNGKAVDETQMTVRDAVQCLGFSEDQLFGHMTNEVKGEQMPTTITLQSLEAIMSVARTSCMMLPLGSGESNATMLNENYIDRTKECGRVLFKPKPRPGQIDFLPAT